jgi:hypothetical protein
MPVFGFSKPSQRCPTYPYLSQNSRSYLHASETSACLSVTFLGLTAWVEKLVMQATTNPSIPKTIAEFDHGLECHSGVEAFAER